MKLIRTAAEEKKRKNVIVARLRRIYLYGFVSKPE